jgi:ferritin-like metal-binding protein YciE
MDIVHEKVDGLLGRRKSMTVRTPLDLFVRDLGDLYDAEQRFTQIIPALSTECPDTQVKAALDHHLQETQQQIQKLEECFRALGTQPQRLVCAAIQGIKQEHDTFLKESPPIRLLQLFDLRGAAKTEAYEIASYQGLVEQARALGQANCAQLLQANLMQEQAMLAQVYQLSRDLGQKESALFASDQIEPSMGQA